MLLQTPTTWFFPKFGKMRSGNELKSKSFENEKKGLRLQAQPLFRSISKNVEKTVLETPPTECPTEWPTQWPTQWPTDPPPSTGGEKERRGRGYAIITTRVSDTRLQSEAKRSAKRSKAKCKPLSHAEQVGGLCFSRMVRFL